MLMLECPNIYGECGIHVYFTGNCDADPPAVQHSTVSLSADGNTARYVCDTGYELIDATQSSTECDVDSSTWNSVSNLCQIKG